MTPNSHVRNADRPPKRALPEITFMYVVCNTSSASASFHPQQLEAQPKLAWWSRSSSASSSRLVSPDGSMRRWLSALLVNE